MASLRYNILSGYLAQVYTALIGIVMVPVYMRHMGVEAYGLVGFFAMLQAWLQLMDMGLTPTLSRELSRHRAGALGAGEALTLVRSLEWLFGLLALSCIALSVAGSSFVARNWLKVQTLDLEVVATCIAIMGGIAGLRWLTGIYRSGLVGLDRQFSVNGATVLFASFRSLFVVGVLIWWSSSPFWFFLYQALVAALECLAYRCLLYRALPRAATPLWPDWSALRGISRFAGSIAFTSGLWVAIMQLDKLVLSHYLSLKDYGYFSLAVSVASGITLLSAPLIQALQPRLTMLASQGEEQGLITLYRTGTQIIAVVMVSLAGSIAAFAEPLIFAWTGNPELARHAAPLLFWYALGNALVGVLSIPYLLQYARGYLRLHVIGNALFGVIWLPAVLFSAARYGGTGTGMTWFAGNLLFLLFWVALVHRRLAPSLVFPWLMDDVARIVVPAGAVAFALRHWAPALTSRGGALLYLLLAGFCTLVTALIFCRAATMKLKWPPGLVQEG